MIDGQMTEVRSQPDRILISRVDEKKNFIDELKNFRRSSLELQKKRVACDQLIRVAKELVVFLKNTSVIGGKQEKSSMPKAEMLIVQARALSRSDNEQSGIKRPKSIQRLYQKMIDPNISQFDVTKEEGKNALQSELTVRLAHLFKQTLNSSLPQLEILLKKFYPKESPENLDKRELRFLYGVAKYVRLERGSAQRSRGLGGLAIPVGDLRDMLGSQELQDYFVNGLLQVLIETSSVCAELKQDLLADRVSLSELKQLQANYDRDNVVLTHSKNIRKVEYRRWLNERAANNSRVAGSPADIDDLDTFDYAHRFGNKVAGVILYGPPGTGKTEKIIEANRRNGFETHLIPMHRYSDFAQLMGEAPVFLEGIDQLSAKLQKVKAFQEFLNKSNEEIKKMLIKTPALFEKLLKLTPQTKLKMVSNNLSLSNDSMLDNFLEELRSAVNIQLVDLFASDDTGNKNTAWVNGEIQRAIKEGKMALLDEGDKADPAAFDGISAILSKQPGESVFLGDQQVQFPHWFRIDMTVNKTNLPDHIRDRFTPIKIDYPKTEDLMWKLGLFLSDADGNLSVDVDTEWQIVLFFSHVVPRIHELYAKVRETYEKKAARDSSAQLDMFPFSMRGITTFCRRVAAGESLERVIEDEILQNGKLAVAGSEPHTLLMSYVSTFRQLTDHIKLTNEEPSNSFGVKRILNSPLYNTIAASEANHKVAQERTLSPVDITNEQIQQLTSIEAKKNPKQEFHLASGALVAQEKLANGVRFDYSYQDGERTRNYFSFVCKSFKTELSIIDADHLGEHLIVKSDDGIFMIAPVKAAIGEENSDPLPLTDVSDVQLSKDGKYVAGITSKNGSTTPYLKVVGEPTRNYTFNLEGKSCNAKRAVMSEDGSAVVIETFDYRVFVIFPEREETLITAGSDQVSLELDQKELFKCRGTSNWTFSGGMLWSPNSKTAYIIS